MENGEKHPQKPTSTAKRPAVRHVEARRTSTCRFGDRVAQISVQHYKQHVPASFRESQQTCVATVLAHEQTEDRLTVLAMGVGTKFLPEASLRKEVQETCDDGAEMYGVRVRDLHAEVLARRAFRRYLTEAIRRCRERSGALSDFELIEAAPAQNGSSTTFQLKDGTTLHFYCSSSPCGNSVIKKFGTMKKEVFRDDLPQQCWPTEPHENMPGHSIQLGQFALLLKKDNSTFVNAGSGREMKQNQQWRRHLTPKQEKWPIYCHSYCCPSGTTPTWSTEGSLHTCSDKLARWNYLGLQGSLLSSLLSSPLYIRSITVGRKFSAMTCRRAVCCRIGQRFENDNVNGMFRLQHPAIMGTSVYLDESGVIDMSEGRPTGQDVRFHSSLCFVSWLQELNYVVECLDGNTGFAIGKDGVSSVVRKTARIEDLDNIGLSAISTAALVKNYLEIQKTTERSKADIETTLRSPLSLRGIRKLKASFSVPYENAKNFLLHTHPVMRQWNRR